MSGSDPDDETPGLPGLPGLPGPLVARGSLRRWRVIGSVAAIALLAASIVLIIGRRDMLTEARASLAHPSAPHAAVLGGGVLGCMVLTGALFSVLMSRYGRVGLLEMQALVAASALVNFLPLRPGLLGRVVYHKAVNKIPPIDSVKTIIQAACLSVSVSAVVAAAVWLSALTHWPLGILVLAPFPMLAVAAWNGSMRILAIAAMIRLAEVLLWALRDWAAFALIGSPIGADAALALACVSMIANLVPFVGNGLGLREWAIGLAAPMLIGCRLELGVTAELVNRAVEIVVVLVVGLAGAGYLTFLRRRSVST